MHRRSLLLISAALVTTTTACERAVFADQQVRERVSAIDLQAAVGDGSLSGVSKAVEAPGHFDLMVTGRGIVRIDAAGAVVSEHRLGQAGLAEQDFSDVASIGNGQYVLLSDVEGYRYDPATETMVVHFCVVPEFSDPMEQKNDALAIEGNLIVAAPRFYFIDENGDRRLAESSLRSYRAGDGALVGSVDLTAERLELTGVAIAGEDILAVQGDQLMRLSTSGELLSRSMLEGVQHASGIVVDVTENQVIVADAARAQLSMFSLE